MGIGDLFKKKATIPQETFICTLCNNEIKQVGKNRYWKSDGMICCYDCYNKKLHIEKKCAEKRICLFHEGDQYVRETVELGIDNSGDIFIVDTGWRAARYGASNGGQRIYKLDSDYFQKNSIDDFIVFLTLAYQKDFSHIKNNQAVLHFFNSAVFKMETNDGSMQEYMYLGHRRYHPNTSATCGYGSDNWFYLCENQEKQYILEFMDDASCGPGWTCTELLREDKDTLISEDVNYWHSITLSEERKRIYNIKLVDVDAVRHLLPTYSRCINPFSDDHYKR